MVSCRNRNRDGHSARLYSFWVVLDPSSCVPSICYTHWSAAVVLFGRSHLAFASAHSYRRYFFRSHFQKKIICSYWFSSLRNALVSVLSATLSNNQLLPGAFSRTECLEWWTLAPPPPRAGLIPQTLHILYYRQSEPDSSYLPES